MPVTANPDSENALGANVTWSRVFAAAFLVAAALLGPLRDTVFPSPYSRLTPEEVRNARAGWGGSDAESAAGAVFSLDPSVRDAMWGTLVSGVDSFTGQLTISGPAPGGTRLTLPVTGRTTAPNELRVRALDTEGKLVREITHPGHDFDIAVGNWDFEVPAGTARLEIVLVDKTDGHGAWLGVGRPAATGSGELDPLLRPVVNAGFFFVHVVAIAGFLFLPGLALRTWKRFGGISIGVLPVPGMAMMAAGGALIWLGGAPVHGFGATFFVLNAVLAAVVLARRAPAFGSEEGHASRLYALLVAMLILWSIVPLTVELEFFPGTNARGRMVASPPDCTIPFFTAAYFLKGDRTLDQDQYFGKEWSATSRGPLVGWMIASGYKTFGNTQGDPPVVAQWTWPADREGYFVARLTGIFTNCLVVLAAPAALAAFAGGRRRAIWFGIGWIALSPAVMINGAFLWPKLLATFFGMLAVAEIGGRRRAWATGAWLSLAYLSHPVGVLVAAPVCLWLGALGWQGGVGLRGRVEGFLKASIPTGLCMIAWAAPWLVFKAIDGKPDVFFRYPFGDGRGFEYAASFVSWFTCRWDNIIYSLVPGTLWHSQLLVMWTGNNISTAGHWAMNCAKTIPFGVGLAMFPIVVWQLFRPMDPLLRSFCKWVLGAGILFMVLIWGFNRDGLGRACLEPMVVLTMVATAASLPRVRLLHRLLAGVVSLELAALLSLAFFADPGFAAAEMWLSTWVLLGATGLAWIALACCALRGAPGEDEEVAR
ncbi:MAG TPA: hypothetical protein VMM36_01495 [Opitutaceae bacterium]|nr:hypothetical protein [Opitutaceae bacterium]